MGEQATRTHDSRDVDGYCMTVITSDTLLLHTDRHARVVAGPGAGKTHSLESALNCLVGDPYFTFLPGRSHFNVYVVDDDRCC